MKDRRLGKFKINRHIIDECPHHVLAIMKDMIIVRAEAMWTDDGIEYVGIHPAFAAVPLGQITPEYYPAITTNGDATVRKVEWKSCTGYPMTDAELNEIFRAIRHRRTLSWATIEKLANEVRDARKPKKATYRWTYDDLVPTRMFPPKPDDLSPKAKEVLDRVSASIQRSYEEKAIESWVGAQTCNVVEPELFDLGEALARSSFLPMVRHQSVFHKFVAEPIADSQKKE